VWIEYVPADAAEDLLHVQGVPLGVPRSRLEPAWGLMDRVVRFRGLLLLLVPGLARADEREAADRTLAAFREGRQDDLRTLAAADDPDPWLVADEFCARGEHDAAQAFAKAAPRKDTERLPEYVAAQRARPADPEARKALAAANALLQGDPQAALASLESVAVPGSDVTSVRLLLARAAAWLGVHRRHVARGEMAEAGEALRRQHDGLKAAAQVAERLGWFRAAGNCFCESARRAWQLMQHADALASLDKALRLQEGLSDPAPLAATLYLMAGIHVDLGSHAKALECLDRTLKIEEALDHAWGRCRALNLIGVIHRRLGAYTKALECLERSLELATNRMDSAATLASIGTVYAALGSYEKALEYYERAVALQEQIPYLSGLAKSLASIGAVHSDLGSHEKALEYLGRALEIAEDPDDVAEVLRKTGIVHARLGSHAKALECLDRALKLYEQTGNRSWLQVTLGSAGGVYAALGNDAEAQAHYRRALELSREFRAAQQAMWATALGRLLAGRLGKPREALPLLEEAIALLEAQREDARGFSERDQMTFFDMLRSGGAFEGMARAQLALGRADDALLYLERGRARGVLDLLERSRFDPLAEASRRAREQGDEARTKEIADVAGALEEADREVTRLTNLYEGQRAAETVPEDVVLATHRERVATLEAREALLGRRARLVRDLLPVGAPATPASLQLGLSPKERMLFYAFDASGGLLLVVPPRGGEIRGYVLTWPDGAAVGEESLAVAIDACVAAMRGGRGESRGIVLAEGAGGTPRRDLFAALVPADLRDEILGLERVYVIPHGPLHRLPFEVLEVGKRRLWLDAGPPVVYGYSGSVLQWCRKRRDAQRGTKPLHDVVALGGAEYAPPLPPLPGSKREVESIRDAFGRESTVGLLGREATAGRLFDLAPKARYLHLATHLIADRTVGFGQSRLLLTPEGDEGWLTLHDVLEHWRDRLSGCELVVLSACETHKGPFHKDEGPYAMSLGFLYAGAPAVIGSLWRVDDESTADLFADFYRRLKTAGKLQAFTDARRELRKKYPEPRFWAPFVYIGDPR